MSVFEMANRGPICRYSLKVFSRIPRPCKLFIEQNNREANSGHDWFCAFKHGFWLFHSLWSRGRMYARMYNCQLCSEGEYTNKLRFASNQHPNQKLVVSHHTQYLCSMTCLYRFSMSLKLGYVMLKKLSMLPGNSCL